LVDHGDMAGVDAGNIFVVMSQAHDKHGDYIGANDATRGVVEAAAQTHDTISFNVRGIAAGVEDAARIHDKVRVVSVTGSAPESDARASVDSMC
jgi:hypothetical protein